jgi:hypothetical protein
MASESQIAANQLNALRSTGPVTPEGKARSSRNALKHGFTSRHLIVHDDERQDFDELEAALLDELAPQGAIEIVTFRELLHAAWNLERFRRLEVDYCAQEPVTDAKDADFADKTYDRISRYQSRAQRAYYRALAELRHLQTNRALRDQQLAEPAGAAEVPVLAEIRKLTKRTQSAASPTPSRRPIRRSEADFRDENRTRRPAA